MKVFNLPDLGEGLQDAEIVSWHVSEGDHVVTDQPLVSVETDKAVVEVPSPQSGRIAKLCGEDGDRIPVGAPLVEFEDSEAGDKGTVVGEIETEAAPVTEAPARQTPGIKAVPAVRALARKLGVDLSTVAASGPRGAITRADVERAAKTLAAAPAQPLRGVRRTMAEKMALAGAQTVPATVTDDADIAAWVEGADISLRLIRAVVAGCGAEPALNAWFDGRKLERRLHEKVDLGIAVDTADGLFVPVLRDAGNREAADLRQGLKRLKADVRARSIPPGELRGQTITLSNFGMIAGAHVTMVVMPPQVAIVGAGRIRPQVVAVEGKPAVHRMLPLSVTFDHRAVTGGEAGRFLAAVIDDLVKEK